MLFIGCKGNTNSSTTKTGELSDKIEFKIYDDSSKIWLDNSHIEEIMLKSDNGEKSIIIKTTEDGKKLLQSATEENMGKIISISANKTILYSALVAEPIKDGEILLNSQYIDYSYLYNCLTDTKDKMADVTPPETLVSEEDAKTTAFSHVNLTADKVSEHTIKLEISEDFFGWKYCIDFESETQKYKCEINAHTGGIIRFVFDYT